MEAEVLELADDLTQKELMAMFGLSRWYLAKILRDGRHHRRRRSRPRPAPTIRRRLLPPGNWGSDWGQRRPRGSRNGRAVLGDQAVAEMRSARDAGATYRELSRRFGVSFATVGRVLTGRSYIAPPPPAVEAVAAVEEPPAPEEPTPPAAPAVGDWRYFGGAPPTPGPRRRNGPV